MQLKNPWIGTNIPVTRIRGYGVSPATTWTNRLHYFEHMRDNKARVSLEVPNSTDNSFTHTYDAINVLT